MRGWQRRCGLGDLESIAGLYRVARTCQLPRPRVGGTFYLRPAGFEALAAAACARSFSPQAVNAARVASLKVSPWLTAIILMLRFSFSERRTWSKLVAVIGASFFIFFFTPL